MDKIGKFNENYRLMVSLNLSHRELYKLKPYERNCILNLLKNKENENN